MNCSPPGFSVHGIIQVRILEYVVIPPPEGLPDPEIEPESLSMSFALEGSYLIPLAPPGKPYSGVIFLRFCILNI